MKTFRRILVALTVIALLVCSAVIVASAAEITVETLQEKFAVVDSTKPYDAQATQMRDLYAYMAKNSIPEGTEGREALYEAINAKSVEVATGLANLIDGKSTSDDMIAAYDAVLAHMTACPLTEGVTASYTSVEELLKVKSAVIANKIYQEAQTFITAETPSVHDARVSYIKLYTWIEGHPIDTTANATLLANASTGAYGCAKMLLTEYKQDGTYFERYASAAMLNEFISCVDLSKTADPNGVNALVNAAGSNYTTVKDEKDAKRIALDAEADFDDYDYTYKFSKDFEDGKYPTGGYNFPNINESHYPTVVTKDGSKVLAMVSGNGTEGKHLYGSMTVKNSDTLGYVAEFDIKFSEPFSGFATQIHKSNQTMKSQLSLSKGTNGMVNVGSPGVTKLNVMAAGVWNHVIITFNPETFSGTVYINYEKLYDFNYENATSWDLHVFDNIRYETSAGYKNQTVYIDNMLGYNGTKFRIFDKFTVMDVADKFEYYVNFFADATQSPLSRNKAYVKASALINEEAVKNAHPDLVELLKNYDYENQIKLPAIDLNLNKITEMVTELKGMTLTSETMDAVAAYITEIDTFISVNAELINKAAVEYREQVARVNEVKADIIKIENAGAFVAAVAKFQRATSAKSMAAHYANAKAVYEAANYYDFANIAFVENDKIIRDFELKLNGEDAEPTDPDYVTIFAYYDTFDELVAAREAYENSVTLTNAMEFITSIEGYEATEAFWAANADKIIGYMNVAREIIFEGNYDASYKGIAKVVDAFNAMDAYFYEVLQKEHIAVIKDQLAKFEASTSYIEKVGVIVYLEKYFSENDFAIMKGEYLNPAVYAKVTDEIAELEQLLFVTQVYYAEIESGLHEEDYKAILAANTQNFIGIVQEMTAFTNYADVKPLFDKATEYYYAMNVDSDAAKAAIEIYHTYRDDLADIEFNSTMFIGAVEAVKKANALEGVAKEDALFLALVDSMKYVDGSDVTFEGVKAAMDTYTAALADYNADADAVNGEIAEITKASCAVRAKSIVITVLAIIGKIFED